MRNIVPMCGSIASMRSAAKRLRWGRQRARTAEAIAVLSGARIHQEINRPHVEINRPHGFTNIYHSFRAGLRPVLEQAFGLRLVLFTSVVTAVPRTCARIG